MLAAHTLISLPCVHHLPRSPASSPAFFSCFPKVFQTHLLKKIDTSPRCHCLPVAPASPAARGVSPWFCFWRPGQLVCALMSLCQVSPPPPGSLSVAQVCSARVRASPVAAQDSLSTWPATFPKMSLLLSWTVAWLAPHHLSVRLLPGAAGPCPFPSRDRVQSHPIWPSRSSPPRAPCLTRPLKPQPVHPHSIFLAHQMR